MRPRGHPDQPGFALVLVLVIITLLAVAALELSREVKLSAHLAGNFEDLTQARLKALDGLSLAGRTLLDDDPAYDAPDEPWARLEDSLAAPSAPQADKKDKDKEKGKGKKDQGPTVPPSAGPTPEVSAQLIDLCGRLNVNLLVDAQGRPVATWVGVFERLLVLLGRDHSLAAALLDWLDPDSESRSGGAEAADYALLGQGIKPRNGPLLDVRELALVKGFDRALLEGDKDRPGLLAFVAVHGGQKLNVNTVPPLLLQALDTGFRESLAKAVVELREERPLRRLEDLRGLVGMSQDLYQAVSPFLDVKSNFFAAEIQGRSGRAVYRLQAVLERREDGVRVVSAEAGR